ncbi:unnamed protein product (macronuclear) [Paramecium tetraurelia]|uniref:Transmembrane protein n=1 Tax=Paramecium tetraurelia TaxID=5888 RepID=A0D833_PARTE|nr:uncharacterized protein GSPATT00014167001 [Paramecium tetraurelia]CAK79200.1 unnamed protein product [Paramecium tetraurelia]|eukprot:XP_001446597.1 hypothetical protein (macronuclear) [Paramecium tetraurelia strain d4-2]
MGFFSLLDIDTECYRVSRCSTFNRSVSENWPSLLRNRGYNIYFRQISEICSIHYLYFSIDQYLISRQVQLKYLNLKKQIGEFKKTSQITIYDRNQKNLISFQVILVQVFQGKFLKQNKIQLFSLLNRKLSKIIELFQIQVPYGILFQYLIQVKIKQQLSCILSCVMPKIRLLVIVCQSNVLLSLRRNYQLLKKQSLAQFLQNHFLGNQLTNMINNICQVNLKAFENEVRQNFFFYLMLQGMDNSEFLQDRITLLLFQEQQWGLIVKFSHAKYHYYLINSIMIYLSR